MTPKQILRTHLRKHHVRVLTRRRPYRELSRRHAREHWQFGRMLHHYHAGTNLGPDVRPSGWYTGLDVVVVQEREA